MSDEGEAKPTIRTQVIEFVKSELQPYFDAGLVDEKRFGAIVLAVERRFLHTVDVDRALSRSHKKELVKLITEVVQDKKKIISWSLDSVSPRSARELNTSHGCQTEAPPTIGDSASRLPQSQLSGNGSSFSPIRPKPVSPRAAPSVAHTTRPSPASLDPSLAAALSRAHDGALSSRGPPSSMSSSLVHGADETFSRLLAALESSNLVIASLHMKVDELSSELTALKEESMQRSQEFSGSQNRVAQLETTLRTHDEWCMYSPVVSRTLGSALNASTANPTAPSAFQGSLYGNSRFAPHPSELFPERRNMFKELHESFLSGAASPGERRFDPLEEWPQYAPRGTGRSVSPGSDHTGGPQRNVRSVSPHYEDSHYHFPTRSRSNWSSGWGFGD